MRASTLLLVIALFTPASADAQISIRPGQYEVTVQMDLGGIPAEGQKAVLDAAGFQKNKRLDCITPDEVKGDVSKMFEQEMEEQNCKMSDVKTTGNKLTFTTTCEEDGVRMIGSNEMTFVGDSFSGITKMKGPDGLVSTMKTTAKRVGECTK